jgi:hypothetical protein
MRIARESDFEALKAGVAEGIRRYMEPTLNRIAPLVKEVDGSTCYDAIIAASMVTGVPVEKFFSSKREGDDVKIRELAWWYMKYEMNISPSSFCIITGHERSNVTKLADSYNARAMQAKEIEVIHNMKEMKKLLSKGKSQKDQK